MITEKDLVTKKYLKSQLDPIKNEFVVLRKEMKAQFIQQKIEIVEEVRVEIHQSIQSAMRNMEAHYNNEIHRTIMASVENIRDENRAFRDGITMLIEKTNDHDRRLEAAGI